MRAREQIDSSAHRSMLRSGLSLTCGLRKAYVMYLHGLSTMFTAPPEVNGPSRGGAVSLSVRSKDST